MITAKSTGSSRQIHAAVAKIAVSEIRSLTESRKFPAWPAVPRSRATRPSSASSTAPNPAMIPPTSSRPVTSMTPSPARIRTSPTIVSPFAVNPMRTRPRAIGTKTLSLIQRSSWLATARGL